MSEEMLYAKVKTDIYCERLKVLTTLVKVQGDLNATAMSPEVDKREILWEFVGYVEGTARKPMGNHRNLFQQMRGLVEMIDNTKSDLKLG